MSKRSTKQRRAARRRGLAAYLSVMERRKAAYAAWVRSRPPAPKVDTGGFMESTTRWYLHGPPPGPATTPEQRSESDRILAEFLAERAAEQRSRGWPNPPVPMPIDGYITTPKVKP